MAAFSNTSFSRSLGLFDFYCSLKQIGNIVTGLMGKEVVDFGCVIALALWAKVL
jgi:hypothetical protein